jgi:hypothetical protein
MHHSAAHGLEFTEKETMVPERDALKRHESRKIRITIKRRYVQADTPQPYKYYKAAVASPKTIERAPDLWTGGRTVLFQELWSGLTMRMDMLFFGNNKLIFI